MTHPSPSTQGDADNLLILLPGLGAVSTTLIAGVSRILAGASAPVGSLTQLGTLEVDGRHRPLGEVLPLASLSKLRFAAWDIQQGDGYAVARRSEVLRYRDLEGAREALGAVAPMPGVHDPAVLGGIDADHAMKAAHRLDQAHQLREDIRASMRQHGARRAVMVLLVSTERYQVPREAHLSVEAFEAALERDDPAITPSQLYAYAALMEGVPFVNGTPNMVLELPCFRELALRLGVPVGGKDLKTGQTLLKTVLAPAMQARSLGVRGWFSTNILGNLDGRVLDDEDAFKSKEHTKGSVLESILDGERQPDLYGDLYHKVRINYYPPHGDAKEGWDNIDLFGWLGYPMQIKVNFLCRDSILAAPVVLDLALLADLAAQKGDSGTMEWLGFYFKAPMTPVGSVPVHDLFAQQDQLMRTLRGYAGFGDAPRR